MSGPVRRWSEATRHVRRDRSGNAPSGKALALLVCLVSLVGSVGYMVRFWFKTGTTKAGDFEPF
ncbi:unnamed protein product [Arabidopsis thaliana]|uniref:Transmembrane protein n=1 Tax=Arabidopsis thaliana TaxID=3702 RepID=A0A5S9WQF7_ARATH|nr:unnamed protein product [Arabidopsis thaliana]